MDIQQHNRLQKLYIDKFYLLDIINNSSDFIFKISGSTNNVYSVKIFKNYNQNKVICDCPDATKWCRHYNVMCKHVLFVIFKVLKLFNIENTLSRISVCENGNQFLVSKNLNKDYIEVISVLIDLLNFKESSENINPYLIDKYNEACKKIENYDKNQKISFNKDDSCCICFDDFSSIINQVSSNNEPQNDLINTLVKCDQCIGMFHKECLDKWLKFNNTCPYCRKPNFSDQISQSKYIKL